MQAGTGRHGPGVYRCRALGRWSKSARRLDGVESYAIDTLASRFSSCIYVGLNSGRSTSANI